MTSEIRFYHLQRQSVEQALPALLDKALQTGKKIIVRGFTEADCKKLSDAIWSAGENSFIPHGLGKDEHKADQPIWITHEDENPNDAKVLIAVNDAALFCENEFDLCCYMFDERSAQRVSEARQRWKHYKDSDNTLTYWQQGVKGWEQKA